MKPVRVLYVEDEQFLGKIVSESLVSRGYEVIAERDGDKVLEVFKSEGADICVLDIMLPNKDGFSIACDIRKLNSAIPIIFLTAKTQTEDVIKGFKSGGNDYIRKPFSVEELIVRMQHLLQRNNLETTESQDIIQMGAYTYQVNRQELKHGMALRKLSYREAELLKLLYEKRNLLIDRREILNTLWGNDSFFNSRNLDVYITKLRGFLKHDDSLQIITIKGIGYRFVVE